jgi:hypothetical protein
MEQVYVDVSNPIHTPLTIEDLKTKCPQYYTIYQITQQGISNYMKANNITGLCATKSARDIGHIYNISYFKFDSTTNKCTDQVIYAKCLVSDVLGKGPTFEQRKSWIYFTSNSPPLNELHWIADLSANIYRAFSFDTTLGLPCIGMQRAN